ncbi:hypothetical protein BDP55DRAFT_643218 [Colletotrichum godetiae]|uniref:Uncharacterized protein n=1 Tax=Colletotrichum godetiae TaxID=1209918 RepID=A0AAJ0AZ69_9PEZI|nr:uncharacterized protein BDP55DRAFT_643218 [Colletotrichum godetiae]KAK1700511.1 hypothetical protein BDP55DRAFT_643218 [Colletotrichum godetiae]
MLSFEYQRTAWNYSISGASIEHSKPQQTSAHLGEPESETPVGTQAPMAPMAPISGFPSGRRPVRNPTTGLFSAQ